MSWFCPACLTRFPDRIERCPADGWPPVEDLSGSELAGRYSLQRLIGVGGMGSTVWLAQQTHIDRPVAVKLLPPSNNETPMRRFAREAKIASNLRHPNIVTIFDYGPTDDGKLFLVMEYLEGITVEQALRGTDCMPVDRALHIAIQVLRALSHAHTKRVVHRDLKPSNLFLTPTGEDPDFVKVLDFGLAKYFQDEDLENRREHPELDVTGQRQVVCGTPSYMAPEQWRGKIDARADIYALGVILYRMLCGELPFTGHPDYELYHKVITKPVKPMREVRADLDLPAGLEGVVMKALAKDPARRYASAREMRADLQRIRGPVEAGPGVGAGYAAGSNPVVQAGSPSDPEAVYLLSKDFQELVTPSGDQLSQMRDREDANDRKRRLAPMLIAVAAGVLTVVFGLWVLPELLGTDTADTTQDTTAQVVSQEDPAVEPKADEPDEVEAKSPGVVTAPTPEAAEPKEDGGGPTAQPGGGEPAAMPPTEGIAGQAKQPGPEIETPTAAPQPGEAPANEPNEAPEPAPKAPTVVELRLTTNPPGATVMHRSEELGTTPLEVELPVGRYALQLSKKGHISEKVELVLKDDHADNGFEHAVALTSLRRNKPRRPGTRRPRTTTKKPASKPTGATATTTTTKPKDKGAQLGILGEPGTRTVGKPKDTPRKPTGTPRIQLLDEDGVRPATKKPPRPKKPSGKVKIETLDD